MHIESYYNVHQEIKQEMLLKILPESRVEKQIKKILPCIVLLHSELGRKLELLTGYMSSILKRKEGLEVFCVNAKLYFGKNNCIQIKSINALLFHQSQSSL